MMPSNSQIRTYAPAVVPASLVAWASEKPAGAIPQRGSHAFAVRSGSLFNGGGLFEDMGLPPENAILLDARASGSEFGSLHAH